MNCPNCGKEIPEDEDISYCPKCGLDLEESMVDEKAEEKEKEKNIKIMRELSKFTFNELLKKNVPREKIEIVKDDLRKEFSDGNLDGLPILLKDCAFQEYFEISNEKAERNVICTLAKEKIRCVKEICPLYKTWKSQRKFK